MTRDKFLELLFNEKIGVRCNNLEEAEMCEDAFREIGILPYRICKGDRWDDMFYTETWPIFIFVNSFCPDHCKETRSGEVLLPYNESFGIKCLSTEDFIYAIESPNFLVIETKCDFSEKISQFLFNE